MTEEQIAKKMRQARSEMPKRTSAQAYAQMERLMKTIGTTPTGKKQSSIAGQKPAD